MKALRAEMQMDGRLKIRLRNEADTVLCVTLTDFELIPLAYDSKRGALACEYRMELTANAVLYDTKSGEVILETPQVVGDSEFPYLSDLTTAKLNALPEAADDLVRKVISLTIMTW